MAEQKTQTPPVAQAAPRRPASTEHTAALARASYMKSLFQGHIEQELILPCPVPGPEERETIEALVGSIREFAERHLDTARYDREKKLPREAIEGVAGLGLFGMIIPEAYGGFGLSYTAYARAMETLCGVEPATAIMLGGHQSIGLKGLLLVGTEEQKARHLPKLATGETIAAFALTEPGAGSDAGGIATTARLSPDGRHYLLNGTKHFITNGGLADFFTVFAKVVEDGTDEKGFTGFIVTRDLPGVSTTKEEEKLGIRASSTTQLVLENVPVPVENLLGRKGRGFKLAMEILNTGRLGLGAGCVGGARVLIREAVQYAAQRRAFGMTIDQFELIQKKIALMNARLFAMESMVYLTTGLADRGGVDFSLESAICKLYCSEALWDTANDAMQIAGGIGYMCEYPYERCLRDSRINLIFEGTNEIMRMFIALTGMRGQGEYLKEVGRALEHPLSSLGIISSYLLGKVKRTLVRDAFEGLRPETETAAKLVAKYARRLFVRTDEAIRHYKKDILTAELVHERITGMAVQLFLLSAVISRMERLLGQHPVEELAFELAMFYLLVELGKKELEAADDGVWDNFDDAYRQAGKVASAAGGYAAHLW